MFFGVIIHFFKRLKRRARVSALQNRGQFDCSVRMVAGSLPGEGKRWKQRVSTVQDGVLHHGEYQLPLLLNRECDDPKGFGLRYDARVWEARTPDASATAQVACRPEYVDQIKQLPMAGAQHRTA